MNKGRGAVLAIAAVLVSLAWAVVLALNLVPELRGDFGWRWPYQVPPDLLRVLPLLLALLAYLLGAWWLLRRNPSGAGALLVWAIVACCGLTLASIYVSNSPLFKLYGVTVSPGVTGWHYAAATITDINQTLRDWPAFMQSASRWSTHLGIVPPGAVLFYYWLNQVLDRMPAIAEFLSLPLRAALCQNFELAQYSNGQLASAWAGILMPLWGALTVLPMYRIGVRLYNERVARWSVLWWPLIPSLLMFVGSLDTSFPLLAACLFLLLVEGLCRGRWWLVFASGALTSVATFISFAFLPLIFLAGMLTLVSYLSRTRLYSASSNTFAPPRASWAWPFGVGLCFGLGLLAVWVVYYALSGITFFDVLRTASLAHLAMDRPYLPWLYLHLYDYFIFTGWPLVILAALGVIAGVRAVLAHQPLTTSSVLALSLAATLIVLDLSGAMRGESGRILLFLTPFLLLIAASALDAGALATALHAGWVFTLGQVVMVLVMVSFLRVIDAEYNVEAPLVPPALTQASPTDVLPSGAVFNSVLRLNWFSGHIENRADAQGTITPTLALWLEWQSSGQVSVPYWMSLLSVAPDGAVGPAVLRQPFDTQYPITCWMPRSGPIQERFEVPLFKPSKDGAWWVSLSLMDRKGNKTSVVMPDETRDSQVGIGPFVRH